MIYVLLVIEMADMKETIKIEFEHKFEDMIRKFEAEHNIEMHIEMNIIDIKESTEN